MMNSTAAPGPLHGVKVLDFSVMISGPLAAMQLADQGANVIKVESPGLGDIMRYLGTQKNGMTGIFANNNRGKRSIVVDLKNPSGIDVVKRLAADADVVVQNFRPGAMSRLGLGYDDLSALNSSLIYASISGYGQDGPNSGRRVYDNVIQAASGLASVQSNPLTGVPSLFQTLLCDKTTAYTVSQAITAALFARATGRADGQHLEIAMLDTAIAFMWPDSGMDAALLDEDVVRLPTIAANYAITSLADGYAATSAVTDAEFVGLCNALGCSDMVDDLRFADTPSRMANLDEMKRRITDAAAVCSLADFVERSVEFDVPAAAVTSLEDLADDAQVVHNDVFVTRDHPMAGRIREPRPAARFSATPQRVSHHAPGYGEHTEEIVSELGLDVESLRLTGAIR
jgi:crotonobetainyl-CoA:carnitine CoA-transferase CaiB-like acyl-CoA transferase